jgi:hypothetical protein
MPSCRKCRASKTPLGRGFTKIVGPLIPNTLGHLQIDFLKTLDAWLSAYFDINYLYR